MSEWIPVSERLPEETGLYLISIGDLVTTASFDAHNFRTSTMVSFIPDAWMPLPEPYKGDYDCVACAHDGDSNICLECENGSKYLKWRTV